MAKRQNIGKPIEGVEGYLAAQIVSFRQGNGTICPVCNEERAGVKMPAGQGPRAMLAWFRRQYLKKWRDAEQRVDWKRADEYLKQAVVVQMAMAKLRPRGGAVKAETEAGEEGDAYVEFLQRQHDEEIKRVRDVRIGKANGSA